MNPLYILAFFLISRYILDSMPQYTHPHILAGLSILQIHSSVFVICGLIYMLYKKKLLLFFDKITIIFFLVLFSYIITAIYTGTFFYLLVLGLKWLYLFVVVVITKESLYVNGITKFIKTIIFVGLYPLANIFYAIVTGNVVHCGGIDRYIGSYSHQSIACVLAFISVPSAVYLFVTQKGIYKRTFYVILILCSHIAEYFISYRTFWVSIVIYWFVLYCCIFRKLSFRIHLLTFVLVSLVILCVGFIGGDFIAERMTPLIEVLRAPSRYLKFSSEKRLYAFAVPKRTRMLSGRTDIWNAALQAYCRAPLGSKIFGLGLGEIHAIEARYLHSYVYAHNEYISSLVETGLQGFIALLLWIVVMAHALLKRLKSQQLYTILSIPVFFQMIITAMGTMVFRNMSACAYLGMYMGLALYSCENDPIKESLLTNRKENNNQLNITRS